MPEENPVQPDEGVTVNRQHEHGEYDVEVPAGVEPDFDADDTDEVEEDVQDVNPDDVEKEESEPDFEVEPEVPSTADQKDSSPADPVAASPAFNPTSDGTPTVNPPAPSAAVPSPPKGGSV